MRIAVHFYSYFKELTGCAQTDERLAEGETINDMLDKLSARFPRFAPMRKSTLTAVGVEYQARDYALKDGDVISLFPPVQGG
jgi:MoaD family protein